MKKLITLTLIALSTICCFTSCTADEHRTESETEFFEPEMVIRSSEPEETTLKGVENDLGCHNSIPDDMEEGPSDMVSMDDDVPSITIVDIEEEEENVPISLPLYYEVTEENVVYLVSEDEATKIEWGVVGEPANNYPPTIEVVREPNSDSTPFIEEAAQPES